MLMPVRILSIPNVSQPQISLSGLGVSTLMVQRCQIEIRRSKSRSNFECPCIVTNRRIELTLLPVVVPPEMRHQRLGKSIETSSRLIKQPIESPAATLLHIGQQLAVTIDEPSLRLDTPRSFRWREPHDVLSQRQNHWNAAVSG